jgi:hypothetical protein
MWPMSEEGGQVVATNEITEVIQRASCNDRLHAL